MLVDAAQSFAPRAEARLPELVATAAKGCPPFAAKLLASLQLPLGDRLDIRTQVFRPERRQAGPRHPRLPRLALAKPAVVRAQARRARPAPATPALPRRAED